MARRRPTSGLTEDVILARLAAADDEFAMRALRRYGAWREAVERDTSPRGQRTLRRAWERARDEALLALTAAELGARTEPSTNSHTAA